MPGNTLLDLVKENLVHYCLWNDVQVHEVDSRYGFPESKVLIGHPPNKLMNTDDENQQEWVVPLATGRQQQLKTDTINSWFKGIKEIRGQETRPKRITVGLVNDDGTIVYYFVHDGIVKPRQN